MDASSVSVADLALIGIDPASIASAFGWGFGTVAVFWFIGFSIRLIVDVIKAA